MVTETIAKAVAAKGRGAQIRLAQVVGVQPQTVSKWIGHQVCPDMEKWPAIEDALDLERGTLRAASGLDDGDGSLPDRVAEIDRRLRSVEEQVRQILEELRARH